MPFYLPKRITDKFFRLEENIFKIFSATIFCCFL
nr:MAG TPA_asm: hypothetical protein [Caudoviricetes sp.]